MRTVLLGASLASGVILLDRCTKVLFSGILSSVGTIPAIPPILSWTLVHNTGAAFGLFSKTPFISIANTIIILIVATILLARYRPQSYLWHIAYALILGGALGNLYDRIVFRYVIDFIDFHVWPVFNIADCAITIGVALAGWAIIAQKR